MKARRCGVLTVVLTVLFFGDLGRCFSQNQKVAGDQVKSCRDAKDGQDIIAVINSTRVIRETEIDESIGSQLYNLQERIYNLRKKALEDLVLQILLKEEAEKRGATEEELRKQLMPLKVDVKQSEVDKAYTDILSTLDNMNKDEAKQRIRLELESRRKLETYKVAVSEIMSRAKVETFLSEPIPPVFRINAEGPTRGPRDAPVTVVEFSDFQCPYCKQAAGSVKTLIESYGSRVKWVFKQMPLPIHADAFKAAQASICANEQGKFWEYHDILFSSGELSTEALTKHATGLGLRVDQFNTCLNSETSASIVRRDMQEATQSDVQGTPTYFVNGRIIRGIKSIDDFKKVIDQALQQGSRQVKPASTR
jgi:protein-disulfide isomerase